MKHLHVKKVILALLMMAVVSTVPSCGRKEPAPPTDSLQTEAAPFLSVNSGLNQLAVSNHALYTVIGDELLRFSPSDRRTETVGQISKLVGSPVGPCMLFQADGRLWIVSSTGNRPGDSAGTVQLAPLNADAGTLEEPRYTLPGWPAAAALYGQQFLFSCVTDRTDGQAALHKLDVTNGETQIVHSDSVVEFASGRTGILYAPFRMDALKHNLSVAEPETHLVLYGYDPAQGKASPTAVEVDFPAFAGLGEQYATVHRTDGKTDNYELRLRDRSGQTQKTFSFGSGFSWPALLSNGQHLALLTRSSTGDAVVVFDQALNVLGEWPLDAGKDTELLAMDPAYLYMSRKDQPASGSKGADLSDAASIHRLEYLKKGAAIEEIFIR